MGQAKIAWFLVGKPLHQRQGRLHLVTWSHRPLIEKAVFPLLKVMTALAAQAPLAAGEWSG
jgi:hypothetical protein